MIRSRAALLLGIDIEELYIPFGEHLMTAGLGLDQATYESFERKAQRARDALLDLGVPEGLVRGFEDATSHVHLSGDPLPDAMDFDAFFLMVTTTGHELSALMEDVRDKLSEADAPLYDLGIILARFDLCLRVLRLADDQLDDVEADDSVQFWTEKRDIYERELARVVPILTEMVDDALERAGLPETLDPELRGSLGPLADDLRRWDNGSASWQRGATTHTDDVFRSVGVTHRVDAPDIGASAPLEGSPDQALVETYYLRSRFYERALDGDLAGAEEGQRRLIEETRHTFGPAHEITFNFRNDLALTLLLQGKDDLATDRAYDVAHDVERALGPRHAATAYEQVRTLQILMATRHFDEVLEFYQSKLQWLADSDPDDLDSDMSQTRSALLDLLGREEEPRRKRRRRFRRRKR